MRRLVARVIVEIRGLRKVYDGKQPVTAVEQIDLDVQAGEMFGLLGPNGAGKTTTISICTTRALPTAGHVRIAGVDVVKHPSAARRNMGVVPQYNTLDRSLTIFENIYFHCLYFGFSSAEARRRTQELLAQFHLEERTRAYPSQLSGGLQQRVQIARAIAHRPKVLFLDEPSAGLDPQSRIAMWDIVRGLQKQGITIVLTTHYMEEADALCERIAIIDHGSILVEGSPEKLKSSMGAETLCELHIRDVGRCDALMADMQKIPGVNSVEKTSTGLRVFAQAVDGLMPSIILAAQNYGLRDVSITEPSLETVFIRLTGRELRD